MNNIIKTTPHSLNVYDIKSAKSKMCCVHGRPFYSLSYRKRGSVILKFGKETFISAPDCITFIPKDYNYLTEVTENTHMLAIHFNIPVNETFKKPFKIVNTNPHLKQLFELALKTYSPENSENYECYSYFYKILSELEKHFQKENSNRIKPSILKAKEEIDKNFADNSLLVSSLNISASYLRSEFREAYSVSPIEYLKNIRLKNALSLLDSGYYSVKEIAAKSGYGSVSYFIQAFRTATGYSPKKYGEKIRFNYNSESTEQYHPTKIT